MEFVPISIAARMRSCFVAVEIFTKLSFAAKLTMTNVSPETALAQTLRITISLKGV
jgi:hypothetical protein